MLGDCISVRMLARCALGRELIFGGIHVEWRWTSTCGAPPLSICLSLYRSKGLACRSYLDAQHDLRIMTACSFEVRRARWLWLNMKWKHGMFKSINFISWHKSLMAAQCTRNRASDRAWVRQYSFLNASYASISWVTFFPASADSQQSQHPTFKFGVNLNRSGIRRNGRRRSANADVGARPYLYSNLEDFLIARCIVCVIVCVVYSASASGQ